MSCHTLLDGAAAQKTSELLGDKAFDGSPVRSLLASMGIIATIPPKSNVRQKPFYDQTSYKARHAVDNGFADVKQFRGISTRYDKLVLMYEARVQLVEFFLGTRVTRRGPSKYRRLAEEGVDGQLKFAAMP